MNRLMGRWVGGLILCLGFLIVVGSTSRVLGAEDPFSFTWDSQVRDVKPGESFHVSVLFQIPPGHYLYRNKLNLYVRKADGLRLKAVQVSPAIVKLDRFSHKKLEIFEEFAMISGELSVDKGIRDGEHKALLELEYQGCSPKLCYRQQAKEIPVLFRVNDSVGLPQNPATTSGGSLGLVDLLRASLVGRGWMAYLLAFFGGLLTALTPCVLPLIPLTLAVIGIRRETSHRKNFLLTSVLVMGMALTYAAFGVMATVLGLQLGFLFQNPYFLLFGALLFLFFALSLFGLYELQLPLFLRNLLAKIGGRGYGGALLAGMTMGLLAAPCVGPVIGALLVWVAQTQDLLRGFGLLFVFGLGMGSLILVVGTFYSALAGKLHGGMASLVVKWCLGTLLLIPAAYYAYVAYGAIVPTPGRIEEATSSVFVWEHDFDQTVSLARRQNKRILVDFSAEWCLPCLEWEEINFSRRDVQRAMMASYVPLKVDCTQNTDFCTSMVKKFDVVGWPTILVGDDAGQLVEGSKIVGDVLEPDEFLKYLDHFKP